MRAFVRVRVRLYVRLGRTSLKGSLLSSFALHNMQTSLVDTQARWYPTQLNSTTSMRPLVHSCGHLLWTDEGLSTTRQEGAATRFGVTVHSRGHPLRRASACGRPGGVSSHGDTQRNEKPLLNSVPEQAERPETHHRIPTPHSIPLAILEMLLPNHAN